jgi:hypothetical protein
MTPSEAPVGVVVTRRVSLPNLKPFEEALRDLMQISTHQPGQWPAMCCAAQREHRSKSILSSIVLRMRRGCALGKNRRKEKRSLLASSARSGRKSQLADGARGLV